MQQKKFLCTRLRLASELMNAGFKGEKTRNPFDPERAAWLFEINNAMAEIVKVYYDGIGRRYPAFLRDKDAEKGGTD